MLDKNEGRVFTLLVLLAASVVSAQEPAAEWMAAGTLQTSNADADDQLGPGGALMGQTLAISRDGSTLAIAAPNEDSEARGINGDQADNSAYGAGAVYVFVRKDQTWIQRAYLKASNTSLLDGLFRFDVARAVRGATGWKFHLYLDGLF